ANNRVVDDTYPYYITNEWLNGYRAQRIRDLLTSKGKLALSDMAGIQADQYSLPAAEIVPHFLKLESNSVLEKTALDVLRNWNYVLAPDSIGAAIYSMALFKLERIVFSAMLGDEETLIHGYLGVSTSFVALSNGYVCRVKR